MPSVFDLIFEGGESADPAPDIGLIKTWAKMLYLQQHINFQSRYRLVKSMDSECGFRAMHLAQCD